MFTNNKILGGVVGGHLWPWTRGKWVCIFWIGIVTKNELALPICKELFILKDKGVQKEIVVGDLTIIQRSTYHKTPFPWLQIVINLLK